MRTPIRQVTISIIDIYLIDAHHYTDIDFECVVRDFDRPEYKMMALLISFYNEADSMTFNLTFDRSFYEGLYVESPSLGLDRWCQIEADRVESFHAAFAKYLKRIKA